MHWTLPTVLQLSGASRSVVLLDGRGHLTPLRRAEFFCSPRRLGEPPRRRTACAHHWLSLLLNINVAPRAALSYLEQSWRRSLSAKCLARKKKEKKKRDQQCNPPHVFHPSGWKQAAPPHPSATPPARPPSQHPAYRGPRCRRG